MFALSLLLLIIATVQKPNLFIGTAGFGFGCGSNSPAVQLPYSFVRLGPDTTPLTKKMYVQFQHFGGYDNTDHGMRALSHMHLVGAGVQDMGILGFLPKLSDKKNKNPSIPNDPKVTFYKDTQIAKPGYYSTILEDDIKVQLTTTQRCGLHKYTFPSGNKNHDILIMPTYLLQKKSQRNGRINLCVSGQAKCLEGYIFWKGSFGGRFGGLKIYFTIRYELQQHSSNNIFFYNQTSISSAQIMAEGKQCGVVLETNSSYIVLKVGLSYVDLANARENLMMQVLLQNNTFEDILNKSLSIWQKELSRFQISAVTPSMKQKIDTAIYRTLLTPTIFNDFNGDYMSFANNGRVMKKPQNMKAVYTDMSLWDVHRTQMPWLLFQDLQRYNDIARSLMLINYQGQYMPKWPFAMGPTGCMIGAHANTVLADWLVKQPQSSSQTEKKTVLSYMKRNANERTVHDSRYDPNNYKKLGYIPFDKESRSGCSETLQYSYNDYGISRVAKMLNQTDTQVDFIKRSKFYKNLWNKETKFFEPKYSNGTFFHISRKERTNIFSNYYVEGTAWHYRFYAPHDPQGLIELFGSNQTFVKELNELFYRSFYWPTFWLPNPYYWAGNEHDLFSVWLFGFANRSDLTQKYSRKVLLTQYGNDGAGLPGNDDYATMSAWLIFASLGFYPVPSTENYVLGSPTIHSARIYRRMNDGKLVPFNIQVTGNSNNKHLVKQTVLNGKKLTGNLLSHNDLRESNTYLGFLL